MILYEKRFPRTEKSNENDSILENFNALFFLNKEQGLIEGDPTYLRNENCRCWILSSAS